MSTRKIRTTRNAIRKRNAAFAKLSPEQKRVVIAKDVIDALNAQAIVATPNSYLVATGVKNYGADAQTELLNGNLQCEACAIGSVFVCAVERMNKLTVDDMIGSRKARMLDYLDGVFSPEQLDLMEVAFERTSKHVKSDRYMLRGCGCGLPACEANRVVPSLQAQAEIEAAGTFGGQFETTEYDEDEGWSDTFDADACMHAIMENIIKNNGEFKP